MKLLKNLFSHSVPDLCRCCRVGVQQKTNKKNEYFWRISWPIILARISTLFKTSDRRCKWKLQFDHLVTDNNNKKKNLKKKNLPKEKKKPKTIHLYLMTNRNGKKNFFSFFKIEGNTTWTVSICLPTPQGKVRNMVSFYVVVASSPIKGHSSLGQN